MMPLMSPRILFIGAGAIGSYLGAFLSRSGHDVTLVDPWPEQVEAIRARGISVTGPHEPFEARPTALHVHEAQRLAADFDVAFVAMKAYDTAWATHMALPRLGPAGYVVSAQNCWNDPGVAAIAGQERSVGLVMSKIAVALWEPGHVERGAEKGSGSGHDVFRAGEHDGKITPRVEALAKMLSVVDGAKVTDNLWGERWCKLCANAMGNPVQAMTQLGSLEIAAQPRGREITIRLAAESARVGLASRLLHPQVQRRGSQDVGVRRRQGCLRRARRHARAQGDAPGGTGRLPWPRMWPRDVARDRADERPRGGAGHRAGCPHPGHLRR